MKFFNKIKKIFYFVFLFIFKIVLANGIEIQNPLGGTGTIWELIIKLLDIAFNIAIPLSVAIVIYAGYLYITSMGNEKKIQQAHRALTWGLIGFGVILIAKGIPKLIINFLTT